MKAQRENKNHTHTHTMSFGVPLSQLIVERPAPLSTRLPELDRALGTGGLEGGSIYEVYGPPGVGKTRLGADLVREFLARGSGTGTTGRALWCDTGVPAPLGEMRDVAASPAVFHVRLERFTELLVFFMKLVAADAAEHYGLVVIDGFSQLVVDHVNNLASRQRDSAPQHLQHLQQQRHSLHEWKCRDLTLLFSTMTKYAVQHNCTVVLLDDCMNTAYQTDLPANLEETYEIVADGSNFFVSGGSGSGSGSTNLGGSGTNAARGGSARHVQALRSALVANAGVGSRDSTWEVFLRGRVGLLWDWAAAKETTAGARGARPNQTGASDATPNQASGKSRAPDRVRVAIVYTDLGADTAASGTGRRAGLPRVVQLPLVSAPPRPPPPSEPSALSETPTQTTPVLSAATAPSQSSEVVGDSEDEDEPL